MSSYPPGQAPKRRPTAPQYPDDDSVPPAVRYLYRQERYRAADGKFDGNLNKWGERGWKVESIDRFDDTFLVTYSKEARSTEDVEVTRTAMSYGSFQLFAEDYLKRRGHGWRLEFSATVGSGAHPAFDCVWVKVAPSGRLAS